MVVPRPTFAQVIHSAAFEAALPKFVAYAARLLWRAGWDGGPRHLPDQPEPGDVVAEATELGICGRRAWPEHIDFGTYFRGLIRNRISHRRRHALLRQEIALEDAAEPPAPPSGRDDAIAAARRVAAIKQEIEGDLELEALFALLVSKVFKPAHQAAELGWKPAHLNAVRVKLNRRIAAVGLREGEDDERSRRDRSPRAVAAARRSARRGAA